MTDRLIHQGRLVRVLEEDARLPDGRTIPLDMVRAPGGAVIACVNQADEICLIRQFRHAAKTKTEDGWIWELPAGVLEPDEPPLETAKRELIEEAGVVGKDWHALGAIWSTPGFTDERLHLYFARVERVGDAQPEANEFIEVHWLAIHQAAEMALDNTISDAKTVAGVLRAQAFLAGLPKTGE